MARPPIGARIEAGRQDRRRVWLNAWVVPASSLLQVIVGGSRDRSLVEPSELHCTAAAELLHLRIRVLAGPAHGGARPSQRKACALWRHRSLNRP